MHDETDSGWNEERASGYVQQGVVDALDHLIRSDPRYIMQERLQEMADQVEILMGRMKLMNSITPDMAVLQ